MHKSRYKYILLDADDTLFDFKASEHDAIIKTAEEFGFTVTIDDATRYSKINKSVWEAFEEGRYSREELQTLRFQKWFESINLAVDISLFNISYKENLADSSILIKGALEFIKQLSKFSSLYIVTNGLSVTQRKRFANSPIAEYIKKIYISEEIGFAKPDKRYFDYIFKDLEICDKSQVVIFGDSLTSDMQGGKNAGITTCRYNPKSDNSNTDLCDFEFNTYDEFISFIENT